MPGSRVTDHPHGLSPAGWIREVVLDEAQPLQDYGCSYLVTRSLDP
jgi:hypothetical protein